MKLDDIDRGYIDLFASIWEQAVKDDIVTYKNKTLVQIQKDILNEADRWQR